MTDCSYIKRLQLYLDGWTEGDATRDIEEHLKVCPRCQAEMVELVEANAAALEIVEVAPDRSYWDSFVNRVHNRIIARDVEPVKEIKSSSTRFPAFRLASVLVILIVTISTAFVMLRQPLRGSNSAAISPRIQDASIQPKLQPPVLNTAEQAIAQTNKTNDLSSEASADLPDVSSMKSSDLSSGVRPSTRGTGMPEFKNLSDEIRISSLRGQIKSGPSNESRLQAPSSFADYSSDPSFRLKTAFVGQRILASLGMNAQNDTRASSQGPLYAYNETSLTGAGDDPGAASTWGYLRIASDTSRASEVKKYFIELELMQGK